MVNMVNMDETSSVLRGNFHLLSYVNIEPNARNDDKCVEKVSLLAVSYTRPVHASFLKYVYDYRKLVMKLKFVVTIKILFTKECTLYWTYKMLKFTIKTSVHSLLHVSVHLDHPQGTYADPCWSCTFVGLSVKYIVKSIAVLWQHMFQAVVSLSSAVKSMTLSHSVRPSIHTTAWNTCWHNTAKLLTIYFTDNPTKV
jgi:hypothetical protein